MRGGRSSGRPSRFSTSRAPRQRPPSGWHADTTRATAAGPSYGQASSSNSERANPGSTSHAAPIYSVAARSISLAFIPSRALCFGHFQRLGNIPTL